jgi:hypothetical protein
MEEENSKLRDEILLLKTVNLEQHQHLAKVTAASKERSSNVQNGGEWHGSSEKRLFVQKWSEETDMLTRIIETESRKRKKAELSLNESTMENKKLTSDLGELHHENKDLAKALQSTARRLLEKK